MNEASLKNAIMKIQYDLNQINRDVHQPWRIPTGFEKPVHPFEIKENRMDIRKRIFDVIDQIDQLDLELMEYTDD